MKLTWRVAQETLRTVPPIFGNFRVALKDIEFDGYFIPKGWQVLWTANVTHMDASIYHEPAKFDPSRFENQSVSAAPPCSFVAFGGGPRICPWIGFSRMETLVTMHYLVRHFKWKLNPTLSSGTSCRPRCIACPSKSSTGPLLDRQSELVTIRLYQY